MKNKPYFIQCRGSKEKAGSRFIIQSIAKMQIDRHHFVEYVTQKTPCLL